MTDTYRSAFEGYERYLDELHNLEAQPNETLLPIAAERIKDLTNWFQDSLDNTNNDQEPIKKSFAFPILFIGLGSSLMYSGIREGDTVSLFFGAVHFLGGLNLMRLYNKQKISDNDEGISAQKRRHMYAKFMLQSIEAKIPQKT